jgi:large subunit ribosomal protein L1
MATAKTKTVKKEKVKKKETSQKKESVKKQVKTKVKSQNVSVPADSVKKSDSVKKTSKPKLVAKKKIVTKTKLVTKTKAGPKKAKAQQEITTKAKKKPAETGDLQDIAETGDAISEEIDQEKKVAPKIAKPKKIRSKKYQAIRAKIDQTHTYEPTAAIDLVKKLSYTKFAGTITAHLTVREIGISKELTLPHSTGQSRKIEIASDELLKKIEAGQIDFDVLIASPEFMPKITKYAPMLGPKGLMPNPKNGTLTSNPEKRQQELQAGSIVLKTESKAPLIHVSIGKTDMETKQLIENLLALILAFKGRVKKVVISATMSPGVKVEWEE